MYLSLYIYTHILITYPVSLSDFSATAGPWQVVDCGDSQPMPGRASATSDIIIMITSSSSSSSSSMIIISSCSSSSSGSIVSSCVYIYIYIYIHIHTYSR